jgi:hypothetical protein
METADKMILETIDDALSILGEKTKAMICYYVEREFGLSKEQVPSNIKFFHEALRLIFGVGASPLEKHICNGLEQKFGITMSIGQDIDIVEYVNKLRSQSKG